MIIMNPIAVGRTLIFLSKYLSQATKFTHLSVLNLFELLYTLFSLFVFQLQHEALLSLEHLDHRHHDGFEFLFMKPVAFQLKFDQYCM